MTPAPPVRVSVARTGCGSWACPCCAARLGRVLADRLRRRLSGLRVLMLTFTVDRERFHDAGEAYAFVKRNRSVARAVSAFGEKYGFSTRGEWFSKMELHRDGYCHFHVLLVVPRAAVFPRRGSADDCWSLGFSHVVECERPEYVAKYASKSGATRESVEASGLPAHGVRWTTAARGFWGNEHDWNLEEHLRTGDLWCDPRSGYRPEEYPHVIRLECCDQGTRLLVYSCEPDVDERHPVAHAIIVPASIHEIRHWLRFYGGEPEDGQYVITETTWRRVVAEIVWPDHAIAEDVARYLSSA